MKELVAIVTVVFALSIPIVAIISQAIQQIRKKKADNDIRRLIIEHQTDLETAKCLVSEERKPEDDRFGTLRGGCLLVGGGTGGIISFMLDADLKHDSFAWLCIALGIGLGLLVAFAIEWKLKKKLKQEDVRDAQTTD